jgi:hypothetical protein
VLERLGAGSHSLLLGRFGPVPGLVRGIRCVHSPLFGLFGGCLGAVGPFPGLPRGILRPIGRLLDPEGGRAGFDVGRAQARRRCLTRVLLLG